MTGSLTISYASAALSLINTTASSNSNFKLGSDATSNGAGMALFGSTFSSSAQYRQNGAYVYSNQAGGLTLHAEGANSLYLATNGTAAITINSSQVATFSQTINGSISGNAATATTATNSYYLYLNGGQSGNIAISDGRTAVYRTESGSGGTMSYAPLLHVGGGDTMWQIQGAYAGGSSLQWRSGYAGTWYSWWQILHTGNLSSYALPIGGGTLTGLLMIQAPGGNYNENIRLIDASDNYSVIVFGASGSTGAGVFNLLKTPSNTFQIRNSSSTVISEMTTSGAITYQGNVAAPTFNGYAIAKSDNGTTSLAGKIPVFYDTGNLSTVNPESYSGEVRLGAAWSRGGIYASSTLSMSTSSGNINFVSNDTAIGGFRWDSTNGTRFIVANNDIQTPYTLIDGNLRPVIYQRGGYPVHVLDHTQTSNTNHGPTIQFAFNGYNARQWVIGCSGDGTKMDFGYSDSGYGNTNYNPHNGIAGYTGKTIMRINTTGLIVGDCGTYPTVNLPSYELDVRGNSRTTGYIVSNGAMKPGTGIQMHRDGGPQIGISWYNESYYNWQEYMSPAGATGCGPNGNLTAPSGLYQVSSWALRSRMEGVGSYGWLWEVSGGGSGSATASTVMELDVYGNLRLSSDVVAYASDVRLKTNIKVIENAITKIKAIRGVEYDWLDNVYEDYGFKPNKMHEVGVIAQEVEVVLPEVVLTAPFNGAYKDKHGTDPNFLTVKYDKMVPLLIEAIKELNEKNEKLERKCGDLEDLLNSVIVNYDAKQDRYSMSYGNTTALLVEAIKEQQSQIEELKAQIAYLVENR
jgi:hypothetical protein